MENRMSLGYVKGKYWVTDARYDSCTTRDSYKALMRATVKAGIAFDCSYSYIARIYTAEIMTRERFQASANVYVIKHNNAYAAHPMAAVAKAIREYPGCTPLLRAISLELECEVLKEALAEARKRDAILYKLDKTLTLLEKALFDIHIENYRANAGKAVAAMWAASDEDDDL